MQLRIFEMETEYIFTIRKTGDKINFILNSDEKDENLRDEIAFMEMSEKHNLNEDDLILDDVLSWEIENGI